MDTKEALEWADSREADMVDDGSADLVALVQLAAEVRRSDIRGILRRNELRRLGGSARPDTIEACWAALEAMDIEVIGAADDVAKSRAEAKALRSRVEAMDADVISAADDVQRVRVERSALRAKLDALRDACGELPSVRYFPDGNRPDTHNSEGLMMVDVSVIRAIDKARK